MTAPSWAFDIAFGSGDEVDNWAICEPADFGERTHEPTPLDDRDLVAAVDLLGLEIV